MEKAFQISCESTVDMPYSYVNKRGANVIFYTYVVDDNEYVDDMLRDENALPKFYSLIKNGALPKTSQINKFKYMDYFEELLQKGDVLHLAFGTGMTPSYKNAVEAWEELKEKYPERKMIIVDTSCSSSGYGLLVDDSLDLWEKGSSMEEIANWVESVKYNVHHQFFSTDMKMFKRSGRVSGATAMIATILGICPLMRLNYDGKIISYSRASGKNKAIQATMKAMLAHAEGGALYDKKCFISHSNCLNEALELKKQIESNFPNVKEIKIFDIGTIIASHCGEGTVAAFFYGDERLK